MKILLKNLEHAGYMKELNRIRVNEFKIEDSVTIEELEEKGRNIQLISIESLFNKYKAISLDKRKLALFLNGVMLTEKQEDNIYRIYSENNFIGLGVIKNNLLKRDVII